MDNLMEKLEFFKRGIVAKSYIRDQHLVNFKNEYITVISVESSNKWVDRASEKLLKMWSIIIDLKKDFYMLPGFKNLQRSGLNFAVTPVRKGMFAGMYGIRLYDMAKEPNREIIEDILNCIFQ